jgi:hypothetical protein
LVVSHLGLRFEFFGKVGQDEIRRGLLVVMHGEHHHRISANRRSGETASYRGCGKQLAIAAMTAMKEMMAKPSMIAAFIGADPATQQPHR